jgi:hypothetical protein
MLAGAHPFAEASSVDGFAAVLPSSLDSLFARAFSLDPAERPPAALVFMRSLEQAL